MNSDKKFEHVTTSRRKILTTAASIGLTATIAGCQDSNNTSESTGTEVPDTETQIESDTETQSTLQRDGADAMPASPISTHPRELTLEPTEIGEGWELVSSQTELDGDVIYSAVDEGEQVTGHGITAENTAQGSEAFYGATVFTDSDAAAEVITTTEEYLNDSDYDGYDIDIGDGSVLYTIEPDDGRRMAGAVAQEQNVIVGMSYYGPDDTDMSEWPETVRPFMQSAHALVVDSQ